MGFGYLVIGYIFAMNFVYEGFTMLPGVLLMLNGMLTLGNFNSPLREARLWLFLALPVSVIRFVAELRGQNPLNGSIRIRDKSPVMLQRGIRVFLDFKSQPAAFGKQLYDASGVPGFH